MSYENLRGRRLPFATQYVLDLITYRHLAFNLVGADLRARFRRSYLGILWTIIQPLGFALVIAWVWGSLFNEQSYWDYALYVFSGFVIFEYFSSVMNVSQESLTTAEGYLRQSRIPFLIFQLRTAMTGMVVAVAGSIGLAVLMLVTGKLPAPGLYLLQLFLFYPLLFAFMAPLAIAMSILGTRLRDLKYVTMLGVQALFFVSPVMLKPEALSPEKMALLNKINPLAELIGLFRAPIFEGRYWTGDQVITVLVWVSVLWVAALALAVRTGRRLVFFL